MDMNWLWLLPVLSFAVLEGLALADRRDKLQPLTYWIRKLLGLRERYKTGWWLTGGVLAWLAYHFLIQS